MPLARDVTKRWLLVGAAVLAAFGVGFGVAVIARSPRTVTKLDVVTARKVTNVPLGCRRAISITRRLVNLTDPARIPEMDAEFRAAVDACRIPNACSEAFKQAGKLFTEIQKNHPDAQQIYDAFQASARNCA